MTFQVIAAILSVMFAGAELLCPAPCRCFHDYVFDKAECNQKGLTSIPSPFSQHTRGINLSNNNLTAINEDSFPNLKKLEYLNLSYNMIQDLNVVKLCDAIPSLKNIDFSHNCIEQIPDGYFGKCIQLQNIDLSHNKLADFNTGSFTNFTILQTLSLSSNPLKCGFSFSFWAWLKQSPDLQAFVTCNNDRDVISIRSSEIDKYSKCSGGSNYTFGIKVTFPSAYYLSSASVASTEVCFKDKKPLGTAECIGGNYRLSNIVINPRCMFKKIVISPVTESLQNLTTASVDNRNVHAIVDLVKNLTSDHTILTSIDIISVADVLVHVSKLPSINKNVVDDIFDIIDSVINVDVDTLETSQNNGSTTNRLLQVVNAVSGSLDIGLKTGARFLRDNILMDVYDVSDIMSPVIGIQIHTSEYKALSNSTFQTIMSADNVTLNTVDAAVILPLELIKGINSSARVALTIYRNWSLFSVQSNFKRYYPISRVIAASFVLDGSPVHSLGKYKVQAIFYPRYNLSVYDIMKDYIVCGYWDYDLNERSGGWSTDGCVLNRTESGRFVCFCDHLTNFAVLKIIVGDYTGAYNVLESVMACSVMIPSIIMMFSAVFSFIFIKHDRKGTGQLTLCNLLLSLALWFLLFALILTVQTHDLERCFAVAVSIHYFILAVFMWMLIEGIMQYLDFVKGLRTYVSNFEQKKEVLAWGWGAPFIITLIPVIIELAQDHKLYHVGYKACLISLSALYYSLIATVSAIALAIIIIYIVILKNLLCRRKQLQYNQFNIARQTLIYAVISFVLDYGL